LPVHWQYFEEFINSKRGKSDEEEYVRKHEKNEGPDYWFEIYKLQRDIVAFGRILKDISLSLRRRLLLNVANTNFSRDKIARSYGLTKPRVLAFIENRQRLNSFRVETVGALAILCRVPLSWLENEVVDDCWENEFIRYTVRKKFTQTNLITYLEDRRMHDVKGIILEHQGFTYYLRVEYDRDTFLVEILNTRLHGRQIMELLELLNERFQCRLGFAKTVIQTQVNPVICYGFNQEPYGYIKFI